jgi:hypothetical protein
MNRDDGMIISSRYFEENIIPPRVFAVTNTCQFISRGKLIIQRNARFLYIFCLLPKIVQSKINYCVVEEDVMN